MNYILVNIFQIKSPLFIFQVFVSCVMFKVERQKENTSVQLTWTADIYVFVQKFGGDAGIKGFIKSSQQA